MLTILLGVVFAAAALYVRHSYRKLRQKLLAIETVTLELPLLGQKRAGEKIKGTAVICGGSLAGLFTARVCADHFEKVVVVETEDWLSKENGVTPQRWQDAPPRARVIQWKSAHAWLVLIYYALERLFPNLLEMCKAFGIHVTTGDIGVHITGKHITGPYINGQRFGPEGSPKMLCCSRPGFETLLRALVLDPVAYPNVSQISGTVIGVVESKSERRLEEVSVKTPEGTHVIDAVLVVDCTGPGQAVYKTMPSAPPLDSITETYHPKMNYCTSHFALTPEMAERVPMSTYLLPAAGDVSRCLIMFQQDHLSIAISCGAWGSSKDLPTTLEGIREHVAGMGYTAPKHVWDVLDMLKEVEDTITSSLVRCPASFWTHYERVADQLPVNYVAIGDSVGRVNPVFGQGASKALIGAIGMNTLLHEVQGIDNDFAKRVHKAQAGRMKRFWSGTKSADYTHSTTIPAAGETLEHGNIPRLFVRYIQILAPTDFRAARLAWKNMMALDGTSIDIFSPMLFSKILWMMFTERVLGVNLKA
ncbi:hypothetical protein CYLTODRAFT_401464 [Cylindrobasidium torrendii FP15055 ss-10]|uniref:FAD/NAD(P)-binding domain-containing protein n=1 Tax=Cylindrobasidium torrendii FP15055 ss-10 TaxID=1314674 RepID=A0A0D7B3L9_9AGAR|nr:hypothetical protein CYLTODRAFT_401464 [Cylindrobasidium torrendii FP15055 ss-10]